MKVYKLPFVMLPPNTGENDEPDKYVAEIPLLPGCRAWGDSPEQALTYLRSVAQAFIESSKERGWPLPDDVEGLAIDLKSSANEVLVTV